MPEKYENEKRSNRWGPTVFAVVFSVVGLSLAASGLINGFRDGAQAQEATTDTVVAQSGASSCAATGITSIQSDPAFPNAQGLFGCEFYTNGERSVCVSKPVIPTPPAAAWTVNYMLGFLNSDYKNFLANKFSGPTQLRPLAVDIFIEISKRVTMQELFTHVGLAVNTIEDVRRPKDFVDEPEFVALDQRTHVVEFKLETLPIEQNGFAGFPTWFPYSPTKIPPPASPGTPGFPNYLTRLVWESNFAPVICPGLPASQCLIPPMPPVPANLDGSVASRGWYIQGEPSLAPSVDHALVVMRSGGHRLIGNDTLDGRADRKLAAEFANKGFDVLLVDKRGEGYSDGTHSAVGRELYEMLEQLRTGVAVVDQNGRVGHKTNLINVGKAAQKPVILWGFSFGGQFNAKAMALNKGAVLENERPFGADETSPTDYDIRGVIEVDAGTGSMMHQSSIYALHSARTAMLVNYGAPPPMTGTVYGTMHSWPAYMMVGPSLAVWSVQGAVSAYNDELRGLKEIRMWNGIHSVNVDADGNWQQADAMVDFAVRAANYDGALDNTAQTSVEAEVCKLLN